MKRSIFRGGPCIAPDQLEGTHRNKQLGLIGVDQFKKLRFTIAQVHADQTAVAADAMVRMDDWVANLQFRQVTNDRIHIGLLTSGAPASATHRSAEEFAFCHDCDWGLRRIVRLRQ